MTTIGVFTTHTLAESALNELRAFGVSEKDLSYVYVDKKGDMKDGQSGEKAGVGAATGATAGAIIGGIAGLVVSNIILPGFGSLIVAGPLGVALGVTGVTATAVAGAATGAAAGGFVGALTNLGIDREDAELYEEHTRKDDILVIARGTPSSTEDIFLSHNAVAVKHYSIN